MHIKDVSRIQTLALDIINGRETPESAAAKVDAMDSGEKHLFITAMKLFGKKQKRLQDLEELKNSTRIQ